MNDKNLTEAEEVGLQISKLIQEKNERICKLEARVSSLETKLYETETYRNELQASVGEKIRSYYSLCQFLEKHDNSLLSRYYAETEQEVSDSGDECL